ncbi:HAD family hydrolase [Halobacteriales archaeon Cl-PHB]
MTTAVYFDLDGTLIHYAEPFADILAAPLPDDHGEEMLQTYSDRLLEAITAVEDNPVATAAATVVEQYDLDADPGTMAEAHKDAEVAATRVHPGVVDLLAAVAAHHRTGILTNGDGDLQRRKLEAHGLDDHVETVIVSNDVGVRKPEAGIFEEAKERLPADTHVYVGDTYEEDIEPARVQGFEAVYVGEDHQPDAQVSTRGTEALASLLVPLFEDASD